MRLTALALLFFSALAFVVEAAEKQIEPINLASIQAESELDVFEKTFHDLMDQYLKNTDIWDIEIGDIFVDRDEKAIEGKYPLTINFSASLNTSFIKKLIKHFSNPPEKFKTTKTHRWLEHTYYYYDGDVLKYESSRVAIGRDLTGEINDTLREYAEKTFTAVQLRIMDAEGNKISPENPAKRAEKFLYCFPVTSPYPMTAQCRGQDLTFYQRVGGSASKQDVHSQGADALRTIIAGFYTAKSGSMYVSSGKVKGSLVIHLSASEVKRVKTVEIKVAGLLKET